MGVIKDVDRGYKKLLKRVRKFKRRGKVTVGVHEAEGALPEGEATVLDVATWNEFGTDTIPARSFIRAWFDQNRTVAYKKLAQQLKRAEKGEMTRETALERFALWAVGQIKKRIARGIEPPNAASTVKRKGSSKPLIDTGQLRSSIGYQIEGSETKGRT